MLWLKGKHPVKTAGPTVLIFRPPGSVYGVDLIPDDFPKRFDSEWG